MTRVEVLVRPEVVKAAALKAMTEDALWCRTENHVWIWQNDRTTLDARKRLMEVHREAECDRCGALRVRHIDARTWTVKNTSVRYPTGYLFKGSGRILRSEVYREQFGREGAA